MTLRGTAFGAFAVGVLASGLWAAPVYTEDFATDPVAGGRAIVQGNAARFSYASGQMTAAYDSLQTTSKMVWALGQTFTQNDSFSYDTRFKINSLSAESDQFAQIAFGLMNATSTGNDRAGGTADQITGRPISDPMAWNVVSFDYYPNVSPSWGVPQTLQPTVVSGDTGTNNFFWSINTLFGSSTYLQSALPVGSYLNANVAYDAGTRLLKLSLFDNSLQPVNIIGAGTNNVQFNLPAGQNFSVDSFGLMLWQDTYNTFTSSTAANVQFTNFSVTAVPEPATLLGLALLGPVVLRRKRAGAKAK